MTNNQFKRVEKWLQEFNPGLSIDANGTSYIATNDGMDIVLSVVEDGSGIVFFSPIETYRNGNVPLLLHAMSLNLYRDVSINGCVGFDKQNSAIVYTYFLSFVKRPDDRTRFHDTVTSFAMNAHKVKKLIS